MKAYMRKESPKPKWENVSAKSIICDLENLGKYLHSLANAPSGPFTFLPKELVEIVKSRPDYPELERKMKMAFGSGWELVPLEEADEKLGSGGDKDT